MLFERTTARQGSSRGAYIIDAFEPPSHSANEEKTSRTQGWKNSRMTPTMLLIALMDFLAATVAAELTAVVNTTIGPVQGEILKTVNSVDYAAFKGIRYAKPSLGYLRFKPPIAIDPWTETLNATKDGADCIQLDFNTKNIVGSEDCLFLNVFTTLTNLTETPRILKPVIVWIYGGAFVTGSASSERYRPDYLLEKDVVYAAFNYRIGPLGFLSLNHANATGNAGLKDQLLALKWVKANIAKFGGDPNKITILGQSAGAASVGFHLLSDASVGLFQGAISMSGVPLNPWAFQSPAKAFSRAQQLGSFMGVSSSDPATLLKTFYAASAADFVTATAKLQLTYVPFAPTIEDESIATDAFLTDCPIVKYYSGNFTKVPHLMGFSDDETVAFAYALRPFTDIINEAIDAVGDYGMALPGGLSLAKNLIDTGTNILNDLTVGKLNLIVEETSDLLILAQVDQTQQILSTRNAGKPIYYYHASFYTPRMLHNVLDNETLLGAGHGDDLAYIFYYPEANYSTDPADPMRRTIDRVSTMWTNFAKYGDPTPSLRDNESVGITWPQSGILGRALDIGAKLSVGFRPTNLNTKLIQAAMTLTLRSVSGCIF